MGLRRWIGWLAVAALLLHAGTFSRHNVILFDKAVAQVAASTAFAAGQICHTDADSSGANQGLPGNDGNNPQKPCPICLGLASAFAAPASEAPLLNVPQAVTLRVSIPIEIERTLASRFILPLTRAPPAIA
jgi:hypothetical protein